MLKRPINLAIAEDHLLFRKVLKDFLSHQPNLRISFQASTLSEVLSELEHSPTDILLMDLSLSDSHGAETAVTVRSKYPDIKILVLSASTDMGLISELLDIGVYGYIFKGEEPESLLHAIQATSENRIYKSSLLTEALYWSKRHQGKGGVFDSPVSLNERERKMLQLIWEEKSNQEIAKELFLGIRSIEKIRQDMKEKIGVKSTVGLLKYAIGKKIVGITSLFS
ncbi:MAG: response regulator transcription factor [Bacteroidetes bacterium]|nr:response regulator transcription factor [Bacteroidota bacterium]